MLLQPTYSGIKLDRKKTWHRQPQHKHPIDSINNHNVGKQQEAQNITRRGHDGTLYAVIRCVGLD